jgi:signal transduction histidine kinase
VLSLGADAVAEVRRIARGLRPPELDELGLAGAVRQTVAELTGSVHVTVAPVDLPALPAAVEVAAYAIVREALTNVVRHAGATHAAVRLDVDGPRLVVEVADDGCGLPGAVTTGVGLASTRERAQELGGTCAVAAQPGGGTVVSARLPLSPEGIRGSASRRWRPAGRLRTAAVGGGRCATRVATPAARPGKRAALLGC